jgi:hypothetical protein
MYKIVNSPLNLNIFRRQKLLLLLNILLLDGHKAIKRKGLLPHRQVDQHQASNLMQIELNPILDDIIDRLDQLL